MMYFSKEELLAIDELLCNLFMNGNMTIVEAELHVKVLKQPESMK